MEMINYDPTRPHITDMEGKRVVRGPDWSYGTQDKFPGNVGTVTGLANSDNPKYLWVEVQWDNGGENHYRWGHENHWDLEIVEGAAAEPKESPAPKFKEGDRVKVVNTDGQLEDCAEVGDLGTVMSGPDEDGDFYVKFDTGETYYASPSELEPTDEPKPEDDGEEGERTYKVGDHVRITDDSEYEERRGQVGVIEQDDQGEENATNPYMVRFDDGDFEWCDLDDLVRAEKPEEAKPATFKLRDKVRLKPGAADALGIKPEYEGQVGEVSRVDEPQVIYPDGRTWWVQWRYLEMVARKATPEPGVGSYVRFGAEHWGVEGGTIPAGTIVKVDRQDPGNPNHFWTEPAGAYTGGVCFSFGQAGIEIVDGPEAPQAAPDAKPAAPGQHPTGPEFVGATVKMLAAAGEACDCPFYADFKDKELTIVRWDADDEKTPLLARHGDDEDEEHWFAPDHLEVVAMPGTPEAKKHEPAKAGEQAELGAKLELTAKQIAPFEAEIVAMRALQQAFSERTRKVFEDLARKFGFDNLEALHQAGFKISIHRDTGMAELEKGGGEGGPRELMEMLRRVAGR